MIKSYIVLKKYPDFIKVWIAGVINTFGDSFDALAMSWLVYEITGSKFWFALNFTINAIPNLIIQPFLGVYIERLSKRWVMVITDVGRGVLVLTLIMITNLGYTNGYLILVFTFLMTCMESLRQPAATSLMPHIVDVEHFESATSLRQMSATLSALIGTSLAGIVIAMFGSIAALWVDGVSFFISALILIRLKTDARNRSIEKQSYSESLKEGWETFIHHPYLVKLTVVIFLMQVFLTGINIIMTPITIEVIFGGPETLAFLNILFLLGTLFGSFIYPTLAQKYNPYTLFIVSGLVGCSGLLLMGTVGYVSFMTAMMGISVTVLSVGFGILNPTINVSLMKSVDKDQLARVSALLNAAVYGSMPLGSLITTLLMTQIPLPLIAMTYGILLISILLRYKNDRLMQRMA